MFRILIWAGTITAVGLAFGANEVYATASCGVTVGVSLCDLAISVLLSGDRRPWVQIGSFVADAFQVLAFFFSAAALAIGVRDGNEGAFSLILLVGVLVRTLFGN